MRLRGLVVSAVAAAVLAGALAVPELAEAQVSGARISQPHTGRRLLQLDLHGGFTWYGNGAATGVRFGIPIVRNGFVRSINNSVYINFGADFYWVHERHYDSYVPAVGFPVTLHWEFFFNHRWSAFGEVGVNVYLHPRFWRDGDFYWSAGNWFVAAIGGRFFFNDHVSLTLRVGNPYAAFGVSFFF